MKNAPSPAALATATLDGRNPFRLKDHDTEGPDGIDRDAAETRTAVLGRELADLQELLYGAGTHGLLVILQGMDTSGKDGAIRGVMGPLSPLGVRVAAFKQPTPEELSHDFLWRIHRQAPAKGEMVVFNRSHYEDVLIVRVHGLVPTPVWKARYERINQFEALLAESGIVIVKLFLNISHAEQEERLLAREADVTKAWKLSPGDWKERTLWKDYQRAYEDALNACATPAAPWHVIPADRKWYRDLVVAEALAAALRPLKKSWMAALSARGAAAAEELKAMRAAAKG